MYERHAQLGRALQGAGGNALQQLLNDSARLSTLNATDIVRLINLGLKAEAESLGQTRDRTELATALANVMTEAVVRLFLEVNEVEDREVRAERFAAGLDELITHYLNTEV